MGFDQILVTIASNDTGFVLSKYPPERIRNFSIIAYVDHGKSTLADRLLELTGTIKRGHGQPQHLYKSQVERERGITVKAQTATMFHEHSIDGPNMADGQEPPSFLLNLIETPGHVNFSYKVSRSLAACQGALLVADACQGVRAQKVANFYLAFESNLTIIPIVNKIDQPTADPDRTSCSDDYYDDYRAVICHVAVVDGALHKGDKISSAATGRSYEDLDVSIMHPELKPTGVLYTGQGLLILIVMLDNSTTVIFQDFILLACANSFLDGVSSLCFKPAKHMVFSGLYPVDGSDFDALNHAIVKLTCNDASVSVAEESSMALGLGNASFMINFFVYDKSKSASRVNGIESVTSEYATFDYEDSGETRKREPSRYDEVISSSPGLWFLPECWSGKHDPSVLANELEKILSTLFYPLRCYQASDLVKLDFLLNGQRVDAPATIVHKLKALRVVSAMRKNVLAKCYGGDVTRKRKLLEKQKEGKKRMKRVESIDLPREAFYEFLKIS
ncbi:GTP-binding protein LepA, C-terminal [Dillenia turbinata]|uniref:GTP-binding protein LepA, C-terminal n=1 Tax=Dillenia turbinata TaxID=194707 RepID=A0AAN8VF88_9MAGN